MRPRPSQQMTLSVCGVLAALALGAGCGSDDGGGDGDLSSREKLEVIQARADIAEYCSVQDAGPSDLTDRSLGIMLDAVRDLARINQAKPDASFEIPVEKKSYTMQTLMREQIRELRECGRDGRLQAGVLQASLAQSQQPS